MKLINREEITENGYTYIVETYDDGSVNKYMKPEPEPEPPEPPVTNEELQAQIAELQEQNMALMMGMVDVYAAVTTNKGE